MASGGVRVMEKPPIQLQQRQQPPPSQEALKCPRCDSSNTKFCYYNNYSLSQPRHFCKACKRYWTRGGTLRNVPVGGGCRKNKRVKRPITTPPPPAPAPAAANHQTNPNPNPDHDNQIIPSSTTSNSNMMSNHHLNPLFYGLLPQNPNYPRIFDHSTSIISETAAGGGGYDLLQPHINAGLGFSGALVAANHGHINSNLTFSSYMNSPPMYSTSSSSSNTTTTTMASLLASSLTNQQQRFMGFVSAYDDHQGGRSNSMVVNKDLKIEEAGAQQNRRSMDQWNYNNHFQGQQNNNNNKNAQQMQQEAGDPNSNSSLLWDGTSADHEGGVVWLNNDPTNNIGSSVPSLI